MPETKFPTQDEWREFAARQNRQFDIADLLARMKRDAKAVIEANPRIITGTTTKNFATQTSWRMPEITALAHAVLALHDQVRERIADEDDPDHAASSAAHAIQLNRAYHAMLYHATRSVVACGLDHMIEWHGRYMEVKPKSRKLLECIGDRELVPVRELMKATGAETEATLETQISRLRDCLHDNGCGHDIRKDQTTYVVTYTGL